MNGRSPSLGVEFSGGGFDGLQQREGEVKAVEVGGVVVAVAGGAVVVAAACFEEAVFGAPLAEGGRLAGAMGWMVNL